MYGQFILIFIYHVQCCPLLIIVTSVHFVYQDCNQYFHLLAFLVMLSFACKNQLLMVLFDSSA